MRSSKSFLQHLLLPCDYGEEGHNPFLHPQLVASLAVLIIAVYVCGWLGWTVILPAGLVAGWLWGAVRRFSRQQQAENVLSGRESADPVHFPAGLRPDWLLFPDVERVQVRSGPVAHVRW